MSSAVAPVVPIPEKKTEEVSSKDHLIKLLTDSREKVADSFVRIKKEVSEFHPPASLSKKQKLWEFCKGLLGGVLPILAIATGFTLLVVYAGPALTTALGIAMPIVAAAGFTAVLTGWLADWTIWTLKKLKTPFAGAGSTPADTLEEAQIVFKRYQRELKQIARRRDEGISDTSTEAMFPKKEYALLVKKLREHAKELHIKVEFPQKEEAFVSALKTASKFSDLGDYISFTTNEKETPKTVRHLISYLNPQEPHAHADKSIQDTYKNWTQFLRHLTKSEKKELNENTEEEAARIEQIIERRLKNFDSEQLTKDTKTMSIRGVLNLVTSLRDAFGITILFTVHTPSEEFPHGHLELDKHELATSLIAEHISGVKITSKLIKEIIYNHFDEISPETIDTLPDDAPNKELYKEWYQEVRATREAVAEAH